jgi:hypothetical protein
MAKYGDERAALKSASLRGIYGIKWQSGQALVAQACNPSYSGDRDQEDRDLKLAWANSSQDPISRKSITKKKKTGGVAQGIGPEFKSQYLKKEEKRGRVTEALEKGIGSEGISGLHMLHQSSSLFVGRMLGKWRP